MIPSPRPRRFAVAVLLAHLALPAHAQERGLPALADALEGLGTNTRVLVIAAHPDDEDTNLITWLAKGRHVETAYLALTRGDGGQNLIGNELGEPLGAIRTEELLAARRMDGGRQYFTRAFDFGFSKNAEETLTQWQRDSIMRDVVTVVRAFRPHVIVAVFSGTPADGHGHHQASGIFAREAYEVAADTIKYPRRLTAGLGPWTVQKFYRGAFFRGQDQATLRMNVGEYDAVLGRSYAEIAGDSRSQHKSQAMGTLQVKGPRFDLLLREAARVGPADARTERTLFDGIDTTWARFKGAMRTAAQRAALDSLPAAYAAVQAGPSPVAPEGVVPALARVQQLLGRICGPASPENPCAGLASDGKQLVIRDADLFASMETASARLERALALATGVAVEVAGPREVVATGEPFSATYAMYNRGKLPVHLVRRVLVQAGAGMTPIAGELEVVDPDSVVRDSIAVTVGAIAQPWWLAVPRQGAMFGVPGEPVDEGSRTSAPQVLSFFEVEGASFGVFTPVTARYADPIRGELTPPVAGAPAVTLTLDRSVEYARANTPIQRTITVELRSHSTTQRDVDVRIALPAGLTSDTVTRRVRLPGVPLPQRATGIAAAMGITGGPPAEVRTSVSFTVKGRLAPGTHRIAATASAGGTTWSTGYTAVKYDHIRTQRLYRPAVLEVSAVDVQLPRAASVAYIAGVGDNVASTLQQLGLDVTVLDPAALPRTDLSKFTSVVVGTRAYEASPALVAGNARLLDYARNGGTLVVQYGQYEMQSPGIMPYPITLARPADRVTVEGGPVKVLNPAASILNAPNRVTPQDFDGWIQDRTLYMPRTFDPAYVPVLEAHDPNEPENRGALLVAPYGKGTYVYTTLALFRQLPNGVPGAARLFVNLLAAKAERVTQ